MGLDTSHDCWHGSYSAFNRWRDKLAEVAGYTGHPNANGSTTIDIDWGCIEGVIGRDLDGKWPFMPVRPDGTPDPLIVLIAHQDCDGEIQAEFCAPLADRLEELIPLLGEEDGRGHVGLYRDATQTFIAGLRNAAKAKESVEFR